MAARRFRIIDADGHVMEPGGMWERYIAPAYRDRAPRIVRGPAGRSQIMVDGRVCPPTEGHNSISIAMREAFVARIEECLSQYARAGRATPTCRRSAS